MSTFKNFESGDIVSGRIQSVSTGLFSTEDSVGVPIYKEEFLTLDTQTRTQGSSEFDVKSGLYYYDVYTTGSDSGVGDFIMSVSYGSAEGTGSTDNDRNRLKIFPTKAVFTQYKNLILTPDDSDFTFQVGRGSTATEINSKDIYVMSFASSKYKERLDAGNFEFSLSGSSGVYTFVDDSLATSVTGSITRKAVYNIVQGNLETDTESSVLNDPEGIGLFYPNLGIVILNPEKVSSIVGSELAPVNGGAGDWPLNQQKLVTALNGAQIEQKFMRARSTELVPSRQYFIRVKNQEFNYSNNPTFVEDPTNSNSEGKIYHKSFANDPKVFITTVGLYDENNELIAIAKLSQPFLKSFDTEATIKVKLDF